jgi:holo-[acyl-carrier protein] synthase
VRDNISSLAARFAAKEAVSKALGTGIGRVSWRDIEILRGPERQPLLVLSGEAHQLASQLGLRQWSISLSHTQGHAIAFVVATD